MYYVLLSPEFDRQELLNELKREGISSVFHYVPLHSSPAGLRYGRKSGDLELTNRLSEQVMRLPMWVGLDESKQVRVVDILAKFVGRSLAT
jgi:dTDP-4-amino-4,6-dideoxygalactose transaminase